MKTQLTIITGIFLTLALGGCGKDSGSGGGRGGRDDAPDKTGDANGDGGGQVQTKDCDTRWKEKVADAPVGQVKAYDILEVTTGDVDAEQNRTIKSRSREALVSATDEAIVTKTRWEYFQPAMDPLDGENRLSKENFMLTCSPADQGDGSADPEGLAKAGVTIREDRAETITVKAGTFATRYQKIHVKGELGLTSEVLGDHWTIEDETVVVKEKIVVTSTMDGVKSEKTTERELIEYVAAP